MNEANANLRLVTETEARNANWANILAQVGVKLEERMEERVLTDTAENSYLEVSR